MREEEEADWGFDEEPGDEPGGADSASGGQGASSAGAGRELCQSYASFLEANLDEGQGASPAGPLEDGEGKPHHESRRMKRARRAHWRARKQEDEKDPKECGKTCVPINSTYLDYHQLVPGHIAWV